MARGKQRKVSQSVQKSALVKVSNVVGLRDDLLLVYNDMRNGNLGLDEAKQAANVSGKIMASAKSEMEYNKMIQSKNRIPFFETIK